MFHGVANNIPSSVLASILAGHPAVGGAPLTIERLDPALDAVIDAGATIESLGDRFALTEGPLCVPDGPNGRDGYLIFSENAGNVIYKWQAGKPLSVFLDK